MKALAALAVGVVCLGVQLGSNHQVDGFLVTSTAPHSRVSHQQSLVSPRFIDSSRSSSGGEGGRGAAVKQRNLSPSCRSTTCRGMMMSGGFGQQEGGSGGSARATNKKGKKKKAAKGEAAPATADAESKKGSGKRQLFMQFTCNRCDGVSQYMINKEAYEDGIVICTCQHCGVKHLIADNLKKMDVPAFGNNIEEYMQTTGTPDEVTKGVAPGLTPEMVEKFDVAMGKDGVLTLSPKEGVDVDREGSSSASPPSPPS